MDSVQAGQADFLVFFVVSFLIIFVRSVIKSIKLSVMGLNIGASSQIPGIYKTFTDRSQINIIFIRREQTISKTEQNI